MQGSVSLYGALLVPLFLCHGCNAPPPTDLLTNSRTSSPPPAYPAEKWIEKPPAEWPQLVLTNHAEFNGHTDLQGASSFLIKSIDGRELAVTAKHLIGDAGGVEPRIEVKQLDRAIASWRMFPRTRPDEHIFAERLGATGQDIQQLDWLVMEIRKPVEELPSQPLRLRENPVQIGEELFLVGCPYVERGCDQNVYRCKVTARNGDRFRYDVSPPVDIRGFSGAPILDQKGHCAGVMMVWFEPKMQGEKYLEAGGEDAHYIFWQLENARKAKK